MLGNRKDEIAKAGMRENLQEIPAFAGTRENLEEIPAFAGMKCPAPSFLRRQESPEAM